MSAPDEEVARLRAEVDELRARLSASPPGADEGASDDGRTGWWRTPLVTVLVVLGALTAPLSVIATWAHDEIGDTDRYVETVALLATAVLVARDRRRALLAAALAVAVAMVLLGLALNLVRPLYLDAVPDDVLPAEAAAVVYDQLIGFIRTELRAVLGIAVLWYVMLDRPTGGSALLIVVLAVLGIAVVEVVAGPRTAAPVVTDPVSSRPPPPPSPPTG